MDSEAVLDVVLKKKSQSSCRESSFDHFTNSPTSFSCIKVNVKLFLCLTMNHAMKACWGVEIYLHAFFDLGTRWR